MRWGLAALWLLVPALCHAAVADVWPSRVKRLEDGTLEYAYDLRPVKSKKVTLDFGPDADEAEVAAFLKALPNQTTVRVDPGKGRLRLHAPGALEDAPLAPSFAASGKGSFVQGGLGAQSRESAVPALHPDAPHPLPSADLLLWHHRQVQDGVWAALLLGAHEGNLGLTLNRRVLLQRVLDESLRRAGSVQGDARDGARRLAARLAGAIEASNTPGPRPWRSDPELWAKVQEEATVLSKPQPRFPAAPWLQWRAPLGNLPVWDRAVQWPFENTRIGAAAVLTFLAILERDPELQQAWDEHRRLRDRLFGTPQTELIAWYRGALGEGTAEAALEDLSPFLARMPRELVEAKDTAPLIARPHTPVTRFLAQLEGPEQLHGVEELTVALQDGRVKFARTDERQIWAQAKDAWTQALVTAVSNEGERLGATPDYRQRLARTMQALLGAHDAVQGGESWLEEARGVEAAAPKKLRLMVPPHLELEPLPSVYAEIAAGWGRLAHALKDQPKEAKAKALSPTGGTRSPTLLADAQKMQRLFHGLSLAARVALGEVPPSKDEDRRALREAMSFLSRWRTQAELRHDVRYLLPVGEALETGTYVHSGVLGIGRRELEARFEQGPPADVDDDTLFVAHTRAVQRYQLPVLATGAVTVPRVEPLPPAELRKVANAAKKRDDIEAALPGALVRTLPQSE